MSAINVKLSGFTPWAKEMYDMYKAKVCNTFIICGNIGDYAYQLYNLTDYLCKLFSSQNGFDMDACIVYDPDRGGVYTHNKQVDQKSVNSGAHNKAMDLSLLCEQMEYVPPSGQGKRKFAYIIRYPQSVVPNGVMSAMKDHQEKNCIRLHRALTSHGFFRSESIFIFVADSVNDINPMFTSTNIKSHTINLPLPDMQERLTFIKGSTTLAKGRNVGYASNIDDAEFARLTAGLTKLSIEDLILQSSADSPIDKVDVLDKKAGLIDKEYSNIIELLDASNLSLNDFAGQEKIKSYFKEVVIDALAVGNTSIVPKGVLLMGPPGTGKSYFAKCLAGSAGINFVEFKMSKILDKYVGNAEKNLEKAFAVFRALAPVGVFIDEMDQALSRGGENTIQVYQNIFGMFLAELSKPENRGKIIWLGATNYPNLIDEALKRAGRFDKKIPFFAPGDQERKLVLKKRIEKVGSPTENIDFDSIAARTKGFTQAELEGIVVKALELSVRSGSSNIRNVDFTTALGYMSSVQNMRIEEMENIALLECNDLEFLPSEYIEKRNKLISCSTQQKK